MTSFNTLRPRQNGRHFPDEIFKCMFLFENVWIWIKISLKFVPKVRINNIPALVQIMAWRRTGDKPLSEPMVVNLTDKCAHQCRILPMISFLRMSQSQHKLHECPVWHPVMNKRLIMDVPPWITSLYKVPRHSSHTCSSSKYIIYGSNFWC